MAVQYVEKTVTARPSSKERILVSTAADRYGAYCRNFEAASHSPKLDAAERGKMRCLSFEQWLNSEEK